MSSFRNASPGNDFINAGGITDTFKTILRAGGGWGTVSMVRVVLSGTIASVFMGMTGASIGALIWDTATIPFIFSACSGFVLGAVGFYRDAVRKSLRSLDRYPRLLQLHLDANFPHRGFDTWPSTRFRSAYFGSTWVLRSMLVASWLTASNAIDRILEAEEETILAPFTRVVDLEAETNGE
ncbi:hypothetical protein LTR10_018955 [Elasticomyces elasticus]|uniref:Uncharacterized protein n=1 Tax=Exophiala sideris TaxID=1016849 RepID=A0ABR0IYH4_9EURO|nr:hypothetical protein LTR10_018955 [Elasticomyces elasticus]KAK5022291.1 hypothetical protein LTS07_010167 [Exophiala sideris]KAK5027103.1 hypothetical protein LTR13_009713 [Exophiala sideris]KAK5051678.1 hypothetical protein LTR69_010178 [Exophiala sideris]KAK5177643.1 hypothetical protein LTR44_009833 [Eurotiomycetes sp. CCFEE 6388]